MLLDAGVIARPADLDDITPRLLRGYTAAIARKDALRRIEQIMDARAAHGGKEAQKHVKALVKQADER